VAETGNDPVTGSPAGRATQRMPTVYLGYGAPPLLHDPLWPGQLADWAAALPRPRAVLIVSAHWEAAPVALSALVPTELVYDFYGFPLEYYRLEYPAPVATDLAARVTSRLAGHTRPMEVVQTDRGLDHGAYIPLLVMYPDADVPVLQMSMPTLDPSTLLEVGRRLAPLRDEGVLIVGSGFLTHGLPYISFSASDEQPPRWSTEFDAWATDAVHRRDLDALADFRRRGPGARFAHPTADHYAPLFVAVGAADDLAGAVTDSIDGYWYGLAKRSFTFG
jgi:4,5-DOPA dioxygenase extradiol